jgi:hypothetical protein
MLSESCRTRCCLVKANRRSTGASPPTRGLPTKLPRGSPVDLENDRPDRTQPDLSSEIQRTNQ